MSLLSNTVTRLGAYAAALALVFGAAFILGRVVTPVAGAAVPFLFTVTDPDQAALMGYVPTHEKDLHLIVVRRDLTGFQHVHPTLAAEGTWSSALDLPAAGTYRVFADFAPEGLDRTLTLGTDIEVAGDFTPVPLPAPVATSVINGYEVTTEGSAVAAAESEFTVTVDG